jgi:hypothetical protein
MLSAKVELTTSRDLSCSPFTTFLWISFPFEKQKNYGPLIFDQSLQQLLCCQLGGVSSTQQGVKTRLLPGNLIQFSTWQCRFICCQPQEFSKQFGYGFLLNIPTTCQNNATDAKNFVYSTQIHMLETLN